MAKETIEMFAKNSIGGQLILNGVNDEDLKDLGMWLNIAKFSSSYHILLT